MKLAIFSALLLFVGLACSGPISSTDDSEIVVITEIFYPDSFIIHTSHNDIVKIVVPVNALNFEDDMENDEPGNEGTLLFFVEKDLASGSDKGLFIRQDAGVKKLLTNGRDIAASSTDNKKVYFAASDGLYIYNVKENKAEKYGAVTDDLINIDVDKTGDVIYVLTKNNELFKVTDNGEKKVKISDVSNAEQIMTDYSGNLYYYTPQKDVYVVNEGGVKKVEGLPKNANQMTLLKAPFVMDDCIPVVVDNKACIIYANGTSEITEVEIEAKPTAYAMEGFLMQYYAYKKHIYEYNILALMTIESFEPVKTYINDKTDDIQATATRSRGSLKHNKLRMKKKE